MNLKAAEKIIDELIKDEDTKLRTKTLTDDEAIFVEYGAVKFLADFETGPLKLIFKIECPTKTFFENDFIDLGGGFGKLSDKHITKGYLYDHIEFWTMPENEDEFKTLLEKVLNKYS